MVLIIFLDIEELCTDAGAYGMADIHLKINRIDAMSQARILVQAIS